MFQNTIKLVSFELLLHETVIEIETAPESSAILSLTLWLCLLWLWSESNVHRLYSLECRFRDHDSFYRTLSDSQYFNRVLERFVAEKDCGYMSTLHTRAALPSAKNTAIWRMARNSLIHSASTPPSGCWSTSTAHQCGKTFSSNVSTIEHKSAIYCIQSALRCAVRFSDERGYD